MAYQEPSVNTLPDEFSSEIQNSYMIITIIVQIITIR